VYGGTLLTPVTLANLAEGRVAILMDSLIQALSCGYTGDDPDEGQLKVGYHDLWCASYLLTRMPESRHPANN
jgi:hypothetical protein